MQSQKIEYVIGVIFFVMSSEEGNGMVPGLVAIAVSAVFAAGVGFLILQFIPKLS